MRDQDLPPPPFGTTQRPPTPLSEAPPHLPKPQETLSNPQGKPTSQHWTESSRCDATPAPEVWGQLEQRPQEKPSGIGLRCVHRSRCSTAQELWDAAFTTETFCDNDI